MQYCMVTYPSSRSNQVKSPFPFQAMYIFAEFILQCKNKQKVNYVQLLCNEKFCLKQVSTTATHNSKPIKYNL